MKVTISNGCLGFFKEEAGKENPTFIAGTDKKGKIVEITDIKYFDEVKTLVKQYKKYLKG